MSGHLSTATRTIHLHLPKQKATQGTRKSERFSAGKTRRPESHISEKQRGRAETTRETQVHLCSPDYWREPLPCIHFKILSFIEYL